MVCLHAGNGTKTWGRGPVSTRVLRADGRRVADASEEDRECAEHEGCHGERPTAIATKELDHRHHEPGEADDKRDEQCGPDRGGCPFGAAALGWAVVQESQRESPKTAATAPSSTVIVSAVIEIARSPPETGGFGGG